jgi:hypothetical protein
MYWNATMFSRATLLWHCVDPCQLLTYHVSFNCLHTYRAHFWIYWYFILPLFCLQCQRLLQMSHFSSLLCLYMLIIPWKEFLHYKHEIQCYWSYERVPNVILMKIINFWTIWILFEACWKPIPIGKLHKQI